MLDETSCRQRIAEQDSEIGAFVRLTAPDARAPHRGLLAGMPVAIKDIIDTAGLGTEYGSAIYEGHVPVRDADCIKRLTAAGAVILGKTVTTEFAHVTPKATRNPADLQRTPGGSSSGSAAAVAAGMARAALGTQTGGSVIRPAAFCGVYGFKSSIGRTDMTGVHELARSLDTLGWFAHTASDLALLGQVLLTPRRAAQQARIRPRLARLHTPYDSQAAACALQAVDAACQKLARDADIVPLTLDASYGALNDLHRRIVSVEASRAFAAYAEQTPQKLSPLLRDFIKLGQENEKSYAADQTLAHTARRRFDADILGFDAFILPSAPGEAPLGLATTGEATFSLFLSLLGPPCLSLPAAHGPGGAPLGVQLVGACGRDEEVLALGVWAAQRLALRDA